VLRADIAMTYNSPATSIRRGRQSR